jgi:hypothetical protein
MTQPSLEDECEIERDYSHTGHCDEERFQSLRPDIYDASV